MVKYGLIRLTQGRQRRRTHEKVIGADADGLGGIVGYNFDGTVENCYATGKITAAGDFAGGIAGRSMDTRQKIQNCAALNQTISGSSEVQRISSGMGNGTTRGNAVV